MKKTIEQLHQASQYLAAAGISFANKEADDSHTNLGWNSNLSRMETHSFGSNNNQLALNLVNGHLGWLKDGKRTESIDLQVNSHTDILTWISEQASSNRIEKQYSYQFHYDLPYPIINANNRFVFNADAINTIITRLNTGQAAFEKFLKTNSLTSAIRIWPHHFDLGIYTKLRPEASIFLGAGLAIPDSLVDDLYYYASGYNKGSAVETKHFTGLSKGDWRSDWNGATMASSEIDTKTATNFLNEVRKGFLDNV